ncbi:MAG: hypothetical protein JXA17_05630 [Dehalococcoidales bacterium]|nr:hypothetical protein [Dehalococcoidales bacterium]
MKGVKLVIMPLILVSVIALFSFSGCASDGAAPGATTAIQNGMSQAQLEALLADSVANQESINTYRFDLDMDMITDVVGGFDAGKMTIYTRSNGAANVASNQMQMNMEMSMILEGFGEESGSQDLNYDIYMFTDYTYMRMEIPGIGEQWVKMPTTEELETNFNANMVDQQLGPLESAVELELLRYEDVDGVECYVISIVPDMEDLMEWVAQQQGSTQDLDWEEMAMVTDALKKLNYVCYITKDTSMLRRIVIEMEMKFTAEQAGASANDFDTMTMIINMDMKMRDYNEPLSIDLPDEAQDAMDVSDNMFM